MSIFKDLKEYTRNGSNITAVGTVGTGADRNGVANEAMTFTDVDSSYYESSVTSTDITGSFTAIAWINQTTSAPDSRCVFSIYDTTNSNGQFRLFVQNDNTLSFDIIDSTDSITNVSSTRSISNATWEPVAVVFDDTANLIKVYTKQGLDNSAPFTGTLNNPTGINFRIGGYPDTAIEQRPFNGSIGPVYLHDAALTTQQIADVLYFKIPDSLQGAVSAVPLGDLGSGSATIKQNIIDLSDTLAITGTVGDVNDEQGVVNAASEWTGVANSAARTTSATYDTTGSFYTAAKVKLGALGKSGWITSQQQGTSGIKFLFVKATSDNRFLFRLYNDTPTGFDVYSTTVASLDTEYHVMGVYDSAVPEVRIYINGVEENSTAVTGTIPNGGSKYGIGNYYDAFSDAPTEATLDDVIFNFGVPSAGDIAEIVGLSTNFQAAHGVLQVDIAGTALGTWTATDIVTSEAFGPYVKDSAHSLPLATYDISFSAVSGLETPAVIQNLVADQTYYLESVTYQTGYTFTATDLSGSSATYSIANYENIPNGTSVDISDGSYTLTWHQAKGYYTPAAEPVTISGSAVSIDRTYALSNIWYIRPTGQVYGNNDGTTYADAWAGNAGIVWASVDPGDIIRICDAHHETIYMSKSGTVENVMYLDGDDPTYPGLIDGAVEITGSWTTHDVNVEKISVGTQTVFDYEQSTDPATPSVGETWFNTHFGRGYIYTSTVGWKEDPAWFIRPHQLWFNGVRVEPSRFPATSGSKYFDPETSSKTSMTYSGLGSKATNYWQGAEVCMKNTPWSSQEGIISSSTGDTINYPEMWWDVSGSYFRDFSYIENIVGEISQTKPGEWAYLNGELYVNRTYEAPIKASLVNFGVYISEYDYINVDIPIKNTNDSAIFADHCNNITITPDQENIYGRGYSYAFKASTYVRGASGLTNDNIVVKDGSIKNVRGAGAGVALIYSTGVVENNDIHLIGVDKHRIRGRAVGVSTSAGTAVEQFNNIIGATAYSGIVAQSPNSFVHDNIVRDFMLNFNDGAGVYSDTSGNTWYNNTVERGWGWGEYTADDDNVMGYYLDYSSSLNIIRDNIAYDLKTLPGNYLVHLFPDAENNIISDNTGYIDGLQGSAVPVHQFPVDPTNIKSGNTVSAVSTYPRTIPDYNVTINCVPSTGQFREVGGSTWLDSGDTISLSEGYHEIEFNAVANHVTPELLYLSLTENQEETITYLPTTAASVTITITGSDDGRLIIDGVEYANGDVLYIAPGTVSPTWKAVAGYESPNAITPFTALASTDYPIYGVYTQFEIHDLVTDNYLDNVVVTPRHPIIISSLSNNSYIDNVVLTQVHKISITGLVNNNYVTSPVYALPVVLDIDNITNNNYITSPVWVPPISLVISSLTNKSYVAHIHRVLPINYIEVIGPLESLVTQHKYSGVITETGYSSIVD